MTKEQELVYQVKNLLGMLALMLELIPPFPASNLSKVAYKLSKAVMAYLDVDSLTVQELEKLALTDMFQDYQTDESISPAMRAAAALIFEEIISGKDNSTELNALYTKEDNEEDIKVDSIWDIWNESSKDDTTD